ncbi:MAG: DHH family phosphoesterase [Planctomycetes bacterium]|nr:DHH family phosphoesterase [Planctomycetota bacterium]
MNSMDDKSIADAAKFLSNICRPLLISHEKPDGDALGSLVALRSMFWARGIQATAMLFDATPERYKGFVRGDAFAYFSAPTTGKILAESDAIVILDTCAYSQLRPIADWLRNSSVPKLVFDHHQTREDLADGYVIDASAAATCLILYEFARMTRWNLDNDAINALFIGIATDTGWFRHSNTDGRALSAAAELSARGVRPFELFQSLYQQDSAARVKLLGAALASLELHENGLAVMTLDRGAFAGTGATPADTEDIVNEPLRIATVIASILFVEQEDGIVRVNFRSKPPIGTAKMTTPDFDVASLAATFGGGGHRRAAGARINGPISRVKQQVIAKAIAVIAGAKSV